jgi:hypothetical protein
MVKNSLSKDGVIERNWVYSPHVTQLEHLRIDGRIVGVSLGSSGNTVPGQILYYQNPTSDADGYSSPTVGSSKSLTQLIFPLIFREIVAGG